MLAVPAQMFLGSYLGIWVRETNPLWLHPSRSHDALPVQQGSCGSHSWGSARLAGWQCASVA